MEDIVLTIILWSAFLIIPIFFELGSAIYASFVASRFQRKIKNEKDLDYYPMVTLLIPVYNSSNTITKCLESIYKQSYPLDSIEVFLVNNGNIDLSYEIFEKFQDKKLLKMWWFNTENGKAKALNRGIYASRGKYIINIDSDGWLDKDALYNIVKRFENNPHIGCMSGVVLIDTEPMSSKFFKRLLQKCEYYEYADSFLIGKIFESEKNNIYTLSGAFSCFRKESLVKTQMYNHDTLGEDVHMTFQIRHFSEGDIKVCENAFFYTEPIESLTKLQSQRQRWQRSELEVANLFKEYHLQGNFFNNFALRRVLLDHTMVFLKLVWIFAIYMLYFLDYPVLFMLKVNFVMYLIYVFNSFIYLTVTTKYL